MHVAEQLPIEAKEMVDSGVVRTFSVWRRIVMANLFLGYCLYYVTRKSCTYSTPVLLDDPRLPLSNEVLGVMFSVQMLSYSVGKFICGILSDKYSCRLMFSVGLMMAGLCNVLFSFCSSNYHFTTLWLINGFFQGCGWAPIAILVKRWYKPKEIGKIWSFMSLTMNLSSSLIPLLMVTLSTHFNWRSSFAVVGAVSCVFSYVAFTHVKDFPEDVNTVEEDGPSATDGPAAPSQKSEEKEVTLQDFLVILCNKFLVLLSLGYLLWTFLKNGVEDWLLLYLTQEVKLNKYNASFTIMSFQFGGLLSCLAMGFVSDFLVSKYESKMRSSPRLPVAIFCSTFILLWLYLIQCPFVTTRYYLTNAVCFILGFCCIGPQTLYGLLALENAPPGLGGTAHGIAGTASTVGSVFSGYPLSYVIDVYKWDVVFLLLSGVAVVNSLLLLLGTTFPCKIPAKKKDE